MRAEMRFWTTVAERMIHVISAYTGDGVLFTVDTRLRPNGRDGALVQTESNYKDYLAHHAEAWEGIAYMKSRTIAGDLDRGAHFLKELQTGRLAALRAGRTFTRRTRRRCVPAWSASRAPTIC